MYHNIRGIVRLPTNITHIIKTKLVYYQLCIVPTTIIREMPTIFYNDFSKNIIKQNNDR